MNRIEKYLIEAAIGLFIAASILVATFATTTAETTFIYQGF